ncbi:MAG: hypothetical protein HYX26_05760 [Acidobacteriales bacterium]|nr:hypothetical protein [Terriglobales bacterium]
MSDFYVGYQPEAPRHLARFIFRLVVVIAVITCAIDVALVTGQREFPAAGFDYDNPQTYRGTIVEQPVPTFLMTIPGATVSTPTIKSYLLVAPGKHGAGPLVAGFDGRQVEFMGKLIYRSNGTMLEVVPGSIKAIKPSKLTPTVTDLGTVTLTGEIVDTKCYLGVMNPGQGKPHRDCASLCLRGGIPAGLAVYKGKGKTDLYLLLDTTGKPIGRDLLRHAGEKISMVGFASRIGDQLYLKVTSEGE